MLAGVHGLYPSEAGLTGRWRRGRRGPRWACEVEELQQIRLRRVARREMGRTADKSVFDKLDHRRVIDGRVRHIMAPCERGDDDVRYTEAELRGKAINGRCIGALGARIGDNKIAMRRLHPPAWQARLICIRDSQRSRRYPGSRLARSLCSGWSGRATAGRDRKVRRPRHMRGRRPSSSMKNWS